MGIITQIRDFIFRFLIYFVIILWPYTKLQNLQENTEGFKNHLIRNFSYFKIKLDAKAHDELIFTIFSLYTFFELIFGCLGLFNFYVGHLFSLICFFITNFIYFNPLLEENKIKLIDTKVDIFYNIGVFFCLGLLTFYPNKNDKKEKKSINLSINLEDDDMKNTMPIKKKSKKCN